MIHSSEKIPLEEYKWLYTLEATLRWLIKYYCEKQKISYDTISDIRYEAEKERKRQWKREKDERVPKTVYSVSEFYGYLNFPRHYIKIIDLNWPIFEPIFQDKSTIKSHLNVLGPLRHNIAHMRPLNDEQIHFLKANSLRILKFIWDFINEKYVRPALKHENEKSYDKARELLCKGLNETKNELLYDEGDPWIAYQLGKLLKNIGIPEEANKWLKYAEKNMPLTPYKELVENKRNTIESF